MQKSASDYRRIARDSLRGNWGMAVVMVLVMGLIVSFATNMISSLLSFLVPNGLTYAMWGRLTDLPYLATSDYLGYGYLITLLTTIIVGVPSAFLVDCLVGGGLQVGLAAYNINLVQRRPQSAFSTLFGYFQYYGRVILLYLFMSLFTFLWSLLFIIPGIIAAYRYALAPYLMAQNPNLTAMEAINQSKQIMNGRKMDLFVLELTFIGWGLLSMLTCGIGTFWLTAYINAAKSAFYLDATGQLPAESYYPPTYGYGGQPYPPNYPGQGGYYAGQPPQAPYQQQPYYGGQQWQQQPYTPSPQPPVTQPVAQEPPKAVSDERIQQQAPLVNEAKPAGSETQETTNGQSTDS